MTRLSWATSIPVVSTIVPVVENVIVSIPGLPFASKIACRSEPGPESFVFVTSRAARRGLTGGLPAGSRVG